MMGKNRQGRLAAGTIFAVGLLSSILYVGKDFEQGTRTVYAQGEYVPSLSGVESPFTGVAESVLPCVVGVSNRANTFSIISGQTQLIEQSSGSGVVITTQGHVVTNYHVVEGASDVQVLWKGQYLKAEVVGVDELTDLAVLRVMEDVALPAVRMGNAQEVRVGDWAIVVGNPLGNQLADTVTVGVVSALGREIEDSSFVKMIQTDAAINSGNSGGGMFNTKGELIGIPSLKFSSSGSRSAASIEGIAMAIPMDVVEPVVNSIIQHGKVTRPKLGVSVMTLRGSEEPEKGMLPAGVYVSSVQAGSAADAAGIRPHDIIVRIDGKRVKLHTDLTNHIASRQVGDSVVLTVYRIPGLDKLTVQDRIPDGETIDFSIVLQLPSQST